MPQPKKPGLLSVGVGPKKAMRPPGYGPTPAGRPVSNLGRYLIRPTPMQASGFEMLNKTPDAIKQVHQQYLRMFQLPPALQPKYLRKPEVMDAQRSRNISRGWRNPRSLHG